MVFQDELVKPDYVFDTVNTQLQKDSEKVREQMLIEADIRANASPNRKSLLLADDEPLTKIRNVASKPSESIPSNMIHPE